MRLKTFFSLSALALTLVACPAFGQVAEPRKTGDIPGPIDSLSDLQDTARMAFAAADENNDGQISQKEALDAANLAVGGFFFRADQNGDGTLSQEEVTQAREAFFSSKPWLRYIVQTAKTSNAGQNGNAGTQNPLQSVGALIDANNDKQVQASEVRQIVQTTVQGAFAAADTNRDGQLSPAEVNASIAGTARTLAHASFLEADTDKNGQISQAEFEKAIVEPSRTVFQIMDLNHDGQLSEQEAQTFRQVILSKVRGMNFPEPGNSPRQALNRAVGSQTQPVATPAAPPAR